MLDQKKMAGTTMTNNSHQVRWFVGNLQRTQEVLGRFIKYCLYVPSDASVERE